MILRRYFRALNDKVITEGVSKMNDGDKVLILE